MTTTWGPAMNAEIDYRLQRARIDFGRKLFHRKVHAQRGSSPRNPTHRTAI